MKKYAKYKDSGVALIGNLPELWTLTKIKYYCEVKDGTHDTPDYVDEGGYPLVTQKDIANGKLDFSNTKNISESDYQLINRRSNVVQNDLIMSMIGSIGNPAIVDTSRPFSIKNVCLFKTSYSTENLFYIYYYLSSEILNSELNYNSRGGVQGFVSLDVLRNLLFIKPPIAEQNQIVEYLNQKTSIIDRLIQNQLQKIELLKDSIVNYIFYKKDNKNFEILEEFWFQKKPSNWKILKLKEVFNVISDKNHPDERLLSSHQIKGVIFRDEQAAEVMNPLGDISNYKLVIPGDFIISLRSSEGGFEFSEVRGLVSPVYAVLRPKFIIDSIFYKYLFKTSNFIIELNRYIKGIRDGKNINFEDIKEVPIPVPDNHDEAVHQVHEKVNNSFASSMKMVELLKEYRQSLISEVVTGKIDVRTN